MKSIAVWVQKGGTSKSTTAGGLAWALRRRGKVLLVDADPQANLTGWLHPQPFEYELADVVNGSLYLADGAIRMIREGLDLLPSFAIGGQLKDWAETSFLTRRPQAFQYLTEEVIAAGYDYLVYDLGPGASTLERSIIATVDECLPVVRPETFSVDGLQTFEATIAEIRKHMRARVAVPRLVVGALNRSFGIHLGYLEAIEKLPYQVYVIGQTTKLPEAQGLHSFLAEHDAGNRVLAEYERLAEAIA
jgi:chromosome partitioning protein